MIRAAIYARYSSKSQSKYSVEDQFRLCEDYAARNGMVVVTRFGDKAKTGRMARKRDGFNQLCDAGRDRNFEVVIIEGTDRVARNLRISAGFYDLMEHHGIAIHSITGPIDSLLFKVSSLMAEQQSRDAGARTRGRQIERLKATGRVVAGLAYGYAEVQGEGLNRVIIEFEAEVVRRIYCDYADGLSANEIARRLNNENVPGPRGTPWSNTTIRGDRARMTGIIRNPIYVGRILYGRTHFSINPDTDSRVSRPANTADEIVERQAPELRIVDQYLWETVQQRLDATAWTIERDNKGRAMNRAHRKQYLLSGLIVCACCGGIYAIMGKDRYGCSTRKNKGTCANAVTVTREAIETRVLTSIKRGLLAPGMVERFVARVTSELAERRKASRGEEHGLRRDLAALERKIDRLLDQIEDGAGDGRTLGKRLEEREQERDTLRARLDEVVVELPTVVPMPNFAEAYAAQVRALEDVLRDPSLVQRAHETLAKLIEKVALTPDPEAPNGLRVELHGDLARILGVCSAAGNEELPAAFLRAGSQLSVVAGVGFEPTTFRL